MTRPVDFVDGPKRVRPKPLSPTRDTQTRTEAIQGQRAFKPAADTLRVGVGLSRLQPDRSVGMPMYARQARFIAAADTMDRVNGRFGRDAVRSAAMLGTEGAAPMRIPLGVIPEEGNI